VAILKEFREFAVKGNVIDLAVGVIIGAGFNKIVDSLVKDIVMPLVSAAGGDLDFSSKFVVLGHVPPGVPRTLADLVKAGVPVFAWGNFITVVVNFLLLAFIIFLMVRQINRLKRAHEAHLARQAELVATAEPAEHVKLLREIRDSLRR
jgi:large conductance mechanosensitive channel